MTHFQRNIPIWNFYSCCKSTRTRKHHVSCSLPTYTLFFSHLRIYLHYHVFILLSFDRQLITYVRWNVSVNNILIKAVGPRRSNNSRNYLIASSVRVRAHQTQRRTNEYNVILIGKLNVPPQSETNKKFYHFHPLQSNKKNIHSKCYAS